jgi:hypothetical protein
LSPYPENNRHDTQRYLLIACAVLARECYHCAAKSKNSIDIRIIQQGLHDIGEDRMSSALQQEIDAVDKEKYDAILMAYGLCNNGIRGLRAEIPMVIPRAHDCITLLLGSKEAYLDYFKANPGCFYRSVGWTEQAQSSLSNPESTTTKMGMSTYQEYVEKYGEENALYLMETIGNWYRNYKKMTYIDTPVGNNDDCRDKARKEAEKYGWEFENIPGNLELLDQLMSGDWDDTYFQVLNPGEKVQATQDELIIKAEKPD